jgi:hypothetical protein
MGESARRNGEICLPSTRTTYLLVKFGRLLRLEASEGHRLNPGKQSFLRFDFLLLQPRPAQQLEKNDRANRDRLRPRHEFTQPVGDYGGKWKLAHQRYTRSQQESNNAAHQDACNNKPLFHLILNQRRGRCAASNCESTHRSIGHSIWQAHLNIDVELSPTSVKPAQ